MTSTDKVPPQPNVPVTVVAKGVKVEVWGVQVPQLRMLGLLGMSSNILLSAGSVFATALIGVLFERAQAGPDMQGLLALVAGVLGTAVVGCVIGICVAYRQRKSLLKQIKEANQPRTT